MQQPLFLTRSSILLLVFSLRRPETFFIAFIVRRAEKTVCDDGPARPGQAGSGRARQAEAGDRRAIRGGKTESGYCQGKADRGDGPRRRCPRSRQAQHSDRVAQLRLECEGGEVARIQGPSSGLFNAIGLAQVAALCTGGGSIKDDRCKRKNGRSFPSAGWANSA